MARSSNAKATALRLAWRRRDELYARRRTLGLPQPLSVTEITAIREWRANEARQLARADLVEQARRYAGPVL